MFMIAISGEVDNFSPSDSEEPVLESTQFSHTPLQEPLMGMIKEFKEFAIKGNVMDMAVGIIIGAAFGKVITSFVKDVLMPPIGMLMGGVDFTDLAVALNEVSVADDGTIVEAVTINYGMFINTAIDFLIVAFAIFMVIKAMNSMKKKEAEAPAAPPAPTKEETLLTEIRDALRTSK